MRPLLADPGSGVGHMADNLVAGRLGLEPRIPLSKSGVLPITLTANKILVGRERLELSTRRLKGEYVAANTCDPLAESQGIELCHPTV
jgi:hypothetical protein